MRTYLFSLLLSISLHVFSQSYIYETVITGLNNPVEFAFFPNNNVIINEKGGMSKVYNLSGNQVSLFWNFTDSVLTSGEMGLLGVCLDPNYSVNHYVYFYYTHNPNTYRVVRLTENNNIGINPVILFTETTAPIGTIHIGGNIRFGYDNKLYITIGNNGTSANSQSLTTFKGKMLRINANGTIPTDNPFYDDGNPHTGNDDRIWAYGLRNSFDFCFSPFNDSLYATENGDTWLDELNFIRKGKNYGYPICAGYCSPYNPLYKNPMTVFDCCPPVLGSAVVTGIIIYNGNQFPELYGKAIVAGAAGLPPGGLFSCTLGNAPLYDTVSEKHTITNSFNIIGLQQGSDGYIYAVQLGASPNGKLYRIKHDPNGIINQGIPEMFSLEQNYPNPFNPMTSIVYSIPEQELVSLKIYNILGKEISVIVNERKSAGIYTVQWDASNYPSGVYYYELKAGEYAERKKMVLIK